VQPEAMPGCLDDEDMLAWVEGRITGGLLQHGEEHLDTCALCHRRLVAAAQALGTETPRETVLGGYRLVTPMGHGGGGIVYKAQHTTTGVWVALKTVRLRATDLNTLRREIQALRRLEHPSIVKILDSGVDAGRLWYAMELLAGETLADVARTLWRDGGRRAGAGALDRVLGLIQKLCAPIAFMHAEGIVHRDLKPQNVFVRSGDEPVLVDFGLAGQAPGSIGREVLDVHQISGTPAYMSPEQIAGEPCDARTDFYALGCILYELVTGQRPFSGTDLAEVLQKQQQLAPPSLSVWVDDAPPELEALVAALLVKAPRGRIGQASDVVSALARLVAAKPPTLPQRPHVYRPTLRGREQALSVLEAEFDRARLGHGGLALLWGESGLGKTALANELARRTRTLQIFEGACTTGDAGVLQPFVAMIEAVIDRAASDGEVGRKLFRGCAALARLCPSVTAFVEPAVESQGEAARIELFTALARLLAACAAERPVLMVIEDLHWADDLTVKFLGWLSEDFWRSTRLFVVGTCRPSDDGRLSMLAGFSRRNLALDRLDEAGVRLMVTDMLAWPEAPEWLSQTILRYSGGNPFFVAEYVRSAVADGLVRRESFRWVATPVAELGEPPTLETMVQRRLQTLGAGARQVCDAAAVLGRDATASLIWPILGGDETTIMLGISELIASQVLEQPRPGHLRFVHQTLYEVALASVGASRRTALHRLAASEMERGAPETQTSQTLAHHWLSAGEPRRARDCFERAAAQALAVAAYGDARIGFEHAVAIDASLAEPPERSAPATLGLAQASFGLGDMAALERHTLAALGQLGWRSPTTPRQWTALLLRELVVQTGHLVFGARADQSLSAAHRTAALSAGLLSQRLFYLDDSLRMTAMILMSINRAEQSGDARSVPRAYTVAGGLSGLARLRRLSARYFDRARQAAGTDTAERIMALMVEAVMEGSLGRWDLSCVVTARIEALLPSVADPLIRQNALATLCHVDYFVGRYDAARVHAAALLASARASANVQHTMWGLYFVARGAADDGDWPRVARLLEEALHALSAHPERQSEINCKSLLALARLRLGDVDDAVRLADETLGLIRIAKSTGFPSLAGYCMLAAVFRELGQGKAPQSWREVRKALWGFALAFPVARPAALMEEGLAFAHSGKRRLARLCYGLSRKQAVSFGMVRETAVVERLLRGNA